MGDVVLPRCLQWLALVGGRIVSLVLRNAFFRGRADDSPGVGRSNMEFGCHPIPDALAHFARQVRKALL